MATLACIFSTSFKLELIAIWFLISRLGFYCIIGEPLNEFVSHFEPLNYDTSHLERNHQRVRRSLDEDSTLHLDFKAHGREFKLRLKRDTSIFAPDLEVDSDFDPGKVYKGHVEGHDGSFAHGFVHDGIFEGKIQLSNKLDDEFHVEPSSDHFDTQKEFHSVIYKASNLNYPYKYGNGNDLNEKTKKWMEEARRLSDDHFSAPKRMAREVPHRYRRETNDKKICQIQLHADHTFTNGRAGGSKERALLIMSKHVQAVHEIYSQTFFEISDKSEKGFGFAIKRMKANDTSNSKESNNPYATKYIGVEKFLDIISLEGQSTTKTGRVCLYHVFTYRDFEDGVLGLAWVGEQAGKAAGGICEEARKYSDGRVKTLNTGVVTFINYNKQVPSRVSEITFAHELGHNFGSKHDTASCGANGGNFIMFPKATSGNDPNNRKFSQCSIDYISPVIETKGIPECFKPTNASICGNQVVEKGEQCDCGVEESECKHQCCREAKHKNGCQLIDGASCSPSEGLCCEKSTNTANNNCKFKDTSHLCNDGECINDTYCTNISAKCPVPKHKPNNTDCNSNKSVCLSGECSGSRCLKYDREECQCSQSAQQCLLCCMGRNDQICKPLNESDKMIELLPGAPCNNFEGYCDILLKCRGVDSEGPLERIKNLLFGGEAINNLVDWVKTYWWAAILIGIGVVLLMAAFIKVCSVATPSSNPNKPKAKTMSLRRSARPNPAYHNEPPPAYDIEMGARQDGRNGRR